MGLRALVVWLWQWLHYGCFVCGIVIVICHCAPEIGGVLFGCSCVTVVAMFCVLAALSVGSRCLKAKCKWTACKRRG